MTTTSFQDDFHREVERQSKEAEGMPLVTYWRGIRLEDLSRDQLLSALQQACSMLSERDKTIERIHTHMFDRQRMRS